MTSNIRITYRTYIITFYGIILINANVYFYTPNFPSIIRIPI